MLFKCLINEKYTDFARKNSRVTIFIYNNSTLFYTSLYVRQHAKPTRFDNAESWVILSNIEQRIKAKIEAIGTPLKDWNINIYRGILTGFNDAFIISKSKKDEILANCRTPEERKKTDEIIRPILRGRDIKRYGYEFADLYIITTFPSLKIDIESYPAVKQHLLSFGYDRLKQTGEKGARKKTNNKWFETQDSISYWEDFSKQKIIWKIIGNELAFCIENGNFMINNACYLLTGNHLEYIVAFLNSKPIKWFSLQTNMNKTGVGDMQVGAQNISLFPIPIPKAQYEQEIINLLKISDYQKVEKLINEIYQLSEEEIIFIEKL